MLNKRLIKQKTQEHAKHKALGYHDEEIERQKALPNKRIGYCNDNFCAVTHIDFDFEILHMQTISQSNELHFGFIPSGKQSLKTDELSKEKWHTNTCVLGWTVKRIWALGSSGSDVNTVDRSQSKVPPWAPWQGSFSLPVPRRRAVDGLVRADRYVQDR